MTPIEKSQNAEAAAKIHHAIKGIVDAYELALHALASENDAHRVRSARVDAEVAALKKRVEELAKELASEKHEREQEREQARVLVDEAAEALIWASGSPCFAPEGVAHEGWTKLGRPTIEKLIEWRKGNR